MAGHIIVCGMGQVGYRVVSLLGRLQRPTSVVTLPTRDEWVREVTARGTTVLIGDARDPEMLVKAGIAEADAVIAATDQDAVNIGIALDAKRLCPGVPIVLRVFDQGLARQLEKTFDVRRAFGMSTLASPAFAAAALGSKVISTFDVDGAPFVIGRVEVGERSRLQDLSVADLGDRGVAAVALDRRDSGPLLRFRSDAILAAESEAILVAEAAAWGSVSADPADGLLPERVRRSAWAGALRRLRPSELANGLRSTPFGWWVALVALTLFIALSVAIFMGTMGLSVVDALYYVTATITTTGYGDITPRDDSLKLYAIALMLVGSILFAALYSVITDILIRTRFEQLMGRERVPDGDHIVVAGLGNLGYRLVEELRRAGASVIAVERSADTEFVAAIRREAPAVIGDARLADTLIKAGVPAARCLVAATGDDAANLAISLSAKELNRDLRTIVRLFDADFAQKVRGGLRMDAVMSASLIAAPSFVGAALHEGALQAFELGGSCLVVLVRRTVDAGMAGRRPSEAQESQLSVLMRRNAQGWRAVVSADEPLTEGEELIAMVSRPLVA